ncbi:hypothetical protein Clacol_004613 [Clathrus columnatus]|uniref:Peptidase M12A domain-containing protein n=1 Tax=Clathrus columnatus TaxID=1419009 RepID=A0AAV5A9K3_9AGAM|nr:hypothetical protein Clacol_004613 [Clathrus columnatus]
MSTPTLGRNVLPDDPHVCTTIVSPQTNIPNISGLAAVFVREDYLWDNGEILTYTFLDGSQRQHKKVVDTIQEWTYYANVTFELKNKGDDEALIRVSFRCELGDWSLVGKKIKDKKEGCTMNLASVRDSDTCMPWERSVILHEWGHTLGLLHEHQSLAARREFTFNADSIRNYYRRNHPNLDNTFIEQNILKAYLQSDMSNWSEVDTQSIMIYPIDKSFTYEGNIVVGMNTELSEKDKAYMIINYPREKSHEKAPTWTLKYALTVANVPEDVSRTWNTQNVRDYFRHYVQSRWKEDWIKITVEGPIKKENQPFEVFRITTKIERRYSEVQELCRILVRSGFKPPKLQGSRRIPRAFARSRREEIEQFLQTVGEKKRELPPNGLSELHHFLQVQGAIYMKVNDRPAEVKEWVLNFVGRGRG